MFEVDPEWLGAFDAALQELFAIDHVDAGLDSRLISLYSDRAPREAAMAYGDDYDLDRVDTFWPPPCRDTP
ncbi:hypothetical protein [Stenotrophomonas sp. C3(2023)]|uniref:hypothetical protein n=1 Tax=Stenotrophomonas sp. C3(2023) TaxID=3080277 RepID=UPI00293E9DC3|nr:hypothetical protein [Stenotrophomonas sp. C3(2023)]